MRWGAERRALFAATSAVALTLAPALAAHQTPANQLVMAEGEEATTPPTPATPPTPPTCLPHERLPNKRCPTGREQLDIVTVFGIRGSITRVEESSAVAGAQLGGGGVAYDTHNLATIRLAHFAFIGGGTGGVEGGIGLAYAMGIITQVADDHGPFGRIGGRAHLLGNDELYHSLVELPELQIGYQLLRRKLHLELAGRAGAVLVGRYNPDDARRPLGKAFEWGGLASLRVDPVHFDMEWMRIEARASDPDSPVDVLSGSLCGAAFPLGICLDIRHFSGEVRPNASGGTLDLTTMYFGVTIGAGNAL